MSSEILSTFLSPPLFSQAQPISEKEADIAMLCMSFGSNDKMVSRLLEKYKNEITTLKDSKGIPLVARAIQMNDGEAVSFFLEQGQDLNVKISGNQSVKEYASAMRNYGGREPYAWRAIETFLAIKENCPLALITSQDIEALQTPDYSGANIKLYHGTRSSISQASLQFLIDTIAPTGVKEISGTPTLSTKPLGQFFSPGSVGFVYTLPKNLVAFSDDLNPNPGAVVWVDKNSGIARILKEDKALSFNQFEAKAVYRPCLLRKEVYPSYASAEGAYSAVYETPDNEQLQLLTQLKSLVDKKTIKNEPNSILTEKIKSLRQNSALQLNVSKPRIS